MVPLLLQPVPFPNHMHKATIQRHEIPITIHLPRCHKYTPDGLVYDYQQRLISIHVPLIPEELGQNCDPTCQVAGSTCMVEIPGRWRKHIVGWELTRLIHVPFQKKKISIHNIHLRVGSLMPPADSVIYKPPKTLTLYTELWVGKIYYFCRSFKELASSNLR